MPPRLSVPCPSSLIVDSSFVTRIRHRLRSDRHTTPSDFPRIPGAYHPNEHYRFAGVLSGVTTALEAASRGRLGRGGLGESDYHIEIPSPSRGAVKLDCDCQRLRQRPLKSAVTSTTTKTTRDCTTMSKRSLSSSGRNVFHDTAPFDNLIDSNASWRHRIRTTNPDLLPTLANGQQPKILWVGCSDSRCPETTILGLQPGDVFVHRNIANILHPGDINSNAVIEYAVCFLKVKHVVVSGHTSCGGVAAALGNSKVGGVLDVWLAPLRRLRAENKEVLAGLGEKERSIKLVELNVLEAVEALKAKDVVIDAVRERGMQVHGVVYEVGTGAIRELDTSDAPGAEEKRTEAFQLK